MEKIHHSLLLTIGRGQEEIWSRVKETGVVGIIDSYNELIYVLFECCQLKFLIYSHLNMQISLFIGTKLIDCDDLHAIIWASRRSLRGFRDH